MTSVWTNRSHTTSAAPSILGIWRIGETLYRGRFAELSWAQPADAAGSPRWDYVVKRATDEHQVESRTQIVQFVAAASEVAHPNLVAVLDASTTAATPYLVMPRLEGQSMQSHLESEPRKPLPVALWLVRQTAQALDALHGGGWVHGDVKPDNVMVGSRGHVTLIDLGFAARTHSVSKHLYRGTPAYSSPEALSAEMAAMPAMDIFSLGRILWMWLTRTHQVRPGLLEPVAELVEGMVSSNPGERPTASVVARHLLQLEIETLGQHIGPQRRAA